MVLAFAEQNIKAGRDCDEQNEGPFAGVAF
jgi:hypothetical protein